MAGEEKRLLRGRIAYDGSARAADFMAGFSRGWIHWGFGTGYLAVFGGLRFGCDVCDDRQRALHRDET